MRVRFAASAAPLRIGRARLALLGWLAARQGGGTFLLRLSEPAAPLDLAWLELDADESFRLSDSARRQAEAVSALKASGRLYPCFESEDELRWKREQLVRRHKPPLYDRAMLKMTAAQRATAEAGGKRPYWRFLLSDSEISWRDRVAGPQTVKLAAISDPVVVAADGAVSAALAAAIDDVDQTIGLLVRDDTQIEASGTHLDMIAALGGDPAALTLAHVPPLPEPLAAIQVRRLRQDGVEPDALRTLLARPDSLVPVPMAQLLAGFDLSAARRGVRSIGLDRLRALNRLALAALPYEAVADRLPTGADAAFWQAVRGGFDLLHEARHWWDVVRDGFLPPVLEDAALGDALARLPPEPWDATTWAGWTADMPDVASLRLALTGEEAGPDMAGLLPLIGRRRAERRLRLG